MAAISNHISRYPCAAERDAARAFSLRLAAGFAA